VGERKEKHLRSSAFARSERLGRGTKRERENSAVFFFPKQ
jgi:hypothetical protein